MVRMQNTVVILFGIALLWWLITQFIGVFTQFADLLAIFGFAWMLNLLLEPMVDSLARRMNRAFAWTLGYLCVVLILISLGAPMAAQASTLPTVLPGAIAGITARVDQFLVWLRHNNIIVPPNIWNSIESGQLTQQAGTLVLSWSLALLSISGQILLVIGVAAAMSGGDDSLRALVKAVLPRRWFNDLRQLYDDVRRTYSAAIRGQLAIWALGMALSFISMALFNTPNLLLWVGPLALIRLLPYLGGILGGAFTIAILLLTLPWPLALIPVLLVVIGKNLMGYVIEPRLLGRVLRLSPGLVLFVVLAGWKLGGVAGIAFLVPAVAVVQTLAERVAYRREHANEAAANTEAAAGAEPPPSVPLTSVVSRAEMVDSPR